MAHPLLPVADPLIGDEVIGIFQEGHLRFIPLADLLASSPSAPAEDATALSAHHLPADGTDYSLAYGRAIAAGHKTLSLPEGNFDWLTPQNYVQGLQVIGAKEMKTSGVTGTKITAPNGFFKNDNTTRKQVVFKNLHIIGSGSGVGIDGPFGGVVEGCKIEGFDDLIRNLSGYLCFYQANSFANADRGINTADANGTVISQNHFSDNVAVQITTRDGTPQSGVNSGLPLIIRENNFNLTDATTVSVKVRGQIKVTDNYFEKFSGSVANTMIDLEVNRFDHQGAIIEGNELNGQSANCTGIYINGSHLNLENWTEGRITCNRMIGLAHHVVYGPNNRVPGLKVYGNSRTTGDFNIVVENSYQDQHVPTYDGWTYVRLTSDFTTSLATAQASPLAFTPVASATYVIEGTVMVRSATTTEAARVSVVWPTGMSDGVAYMQQAGAAASTVPRYGNIAATVEPAILDMPDATNSWPVKIESTLVSGASPSGNYTIALRAEVAGTNVTMRAGSWIRYRRIA